MRWYAALYIGGMGSREKNFYNQLATRMGFGDAAREVQDLYLAKRQRDAAAAVPLEFIDPTALLGPVDRIAERHAGLRRGRRHDAVGEPASPADADVGRSRRCARSPRPCDRSGVG